MPFNSFVLIEMNRDYKGVVVFVFVGRGIRVDEGVLSG